MRKEICVFLFIIFSLQVAGQSDSSGYTGWYLKVNTFSFMDPAYPTFQFGVEKRINLRHGFEILIGLPLKIKKALKNTDSTYVHFFKIKTEMRFYSNKKPLSYFGLDFFYTHVSYSYFHARFTRSHETFIADYARIKKMIYGLAIKPGLLSVRKETGKISGDLSIGLGVRLRFTKVNDLNSTPYSPGNNEWIGLQPREGIDVTPHVSVGVKIPIKF